MTYEIERKYLFHSVSCAREWMANPRFSWKKIGIIQWYVTMPFDPDSSSRVRYQAKYEGTRFEEQWIYGRKTAIDGDLEKRIEEEKEFSPETAARDLPFLDADTVRNVETFSFEGFPAIHKIRYRMESLEKSLPESEIVTDFFLYPDYLIQTVVLLEVELRNSGITLDPSPQFRAISESLCLSAVCKDVTQDRHFTNHALARKAVMLKIPPLSAKNAIAETKRLLSD